MGASLCGHVVHGADDQSTENTMPTFVAVEKLCSEQLTPEINEHREYMWALHMLTSSSDTLGMFNMQISHYNNPPPFHLFPTQM